MHDVSDTIVLCSKILLSSGHVQYLQTEQQLSLVKHYVYQLNLSLVLHCSFFFTQRRPKVIAIVILKSHTKF